MILSQCLNVVPPGFTGDLTQIGPRDAWWAARGVGKREMLAGDKDRVAWNIPCKIDGTEAKAPFVFDNWAGSLLKNIGSKKDNGLGFVCDIEPEDDLPDVVLRVAAAIGAVNYATLSRLGGSGAALRPAVAYDCPTCYRSAGYWIDNAIMRARNDQLAPLFAAVEAFNLKMYPWLGSDGTPEPARWQRDRLVAMVAECQRIDPTKPIDVMMSTTYLANDSAPTNRQVDEGVATATLQAARDAGVRVFMLYGGNGEQLNGTEGWYVATQKWLGRN